MDRIILEPVQWHRLLAVEDVDPLNDGDYSLLRELGEVLLRHGKAERFGICLLHKHFDLAPDEELVEETDADTRVSILRVHTAQPGRVDSVETMWRFNGTTTAIRTCKIRCLKTGTSHPRGHVWEAH
jgi:hypothetical protein